MPEDPHYVVKQGEREGSEGAAASGADFSSPRHANGGASSSEGGAGDGGSSAGAAGREGDGQAGQERKEVGCEMRWGSVVVRGKFLPDRDGDSLLLTTEQIKGVGGWQGGGEGGGLPQPKPPRS